MACLSTRVGSASAVVASPSHAVLRARPFAGSRGRRNPMLVRADKNAPGPVEEIVNTVEEKAQVSPFLP